MAEMFLVVEFTETKDVAVIPSTWLKSRHEAVWPKYQSATHLTSSVKNRDSPTTEWLKYSIKIMYESDTYEKARAKLPEAVYHSDLHTADTDSDAEDFSFRHSKRRKRSPDRYTDHESSDERGSGSRVQSKTRKCIRVAHSSDSDAGCSHSSDSDAGCSNKKATFTPVPPKPSSPSPINTASRSSLDGSVSQLQSEHISLRAHDARIFMVLEELCTILHSLSAKLDTLLRHNSLQEQDQEGLEGVHFSLNEIVDMGALESKLVDPEQEKIVIARLSVIGGAGLQDTVRRILRHTVTNSLAMQYNWCGKGAELRFCSLKLKDTIIKCVRKNPEHRIATSASIEKVMKEWFRTARDRDGGRRQREIRGTQPQDSDTM